MTHKFRKDDLVRVIGKRELTIHPYLKGQVGRITELFTHGPQTYEAAMVEFDTLPSGVANDGELRRRHFIPLNQLERVWPTEFQPAAPYHARIVLDLVSHNPISDHVAEAVSNSVYDEVYDPFYKVEVESCRIVPTDELDFIADLIEKGEYDQAIDLIDRLERRLGGSTPETTVLSTHIERIRILGE